MEEHSCPPYVGPSGRVTPEGLQKVLNHLKWKIPDPADEPQPKKENKKGNRQGARPQGFEAAIGEEVEAFGKEVEAFGKEVEAFGKEVEAFGKDIEAGDDPLLSGTMPAFPGPDQLDSGKHGEFPGNSTNDNVILLCLDGGGLHILWTLQLLKRFMREVSNVLGQRIEPWQLFNLVAGSSAGAASAALLTKGYTVEQVEEFWLESGPCLYQYANPLIGGPANFFQQSGFPYLAQTVRNVAVNQSMIPLYDKSYFRSKLQELFGSETLGELARGKQLGVLLLSIDLASGSPVELGAYPVRYDNPDHVAIYGEYKNVPVAAAIEAAGSAPLLFEPFGNFIDAGFASYNSPQAVALAAVQGGVVPNGLSRLINISKNYDAYILSIGTATYPNIRVSAEQAENPPPPGQPFWEYWMLNTFGFNTPKLTSGVLSNASNKGNLAFRRYGMAFNAEILQTQLPNLPIPPIPGIRARCLHEITKRDMFLLQFELEPLYSPFYRVLGEAVVQYLEEFQSPPFSESLDDALSLTTQNKRRNIENLRSQAWMENRPLGGVLAPPRAPVGMTIEDFF